MMLTEQKSHCPGSEQLADQFNELSVNVQANEINQTDTLDYNV